MLPKQRVEVWSLVRALGSHMLVEQPKINNFFFKKENIDTYLRLAFTNYHTLSDLNSRHLFLTIVKAEKSKISIPTAEGSWWEPPFPGLAGGYSCCPFLNVMHAHREVSFPSSSYKDTNPIMRVPSSWTNLHLIMFQSPHLQNHHFEGLEFQVSAMKKQWTKLDSEA